MLGLDEEDTIQIQDMAKEMMGQAIVMMKAMATTTEFYDAYAKMQRAHYTALIDNGFSPDAAVEIVAGADNPINKS
tara:strand:- start:66 stop:293 length:228 start_codon:yes stop_codon:yes gene_type:complete